MSQASEKRTEVWSKLKSLVDTWGSRELVRPFVGPVVSGGGSKAIAIGERFVPEASYFSVRMVEMSLREGGKFFASFLPLGVLLAEFTFGDERRRRPTILNNDEIAAQLRAAGASPGYIEFRDIYAVRRAPVKQDNLSLFVGLFRLPYHDVAQQVLQLAADLTAQTRLVAPGVGEGLQVAEKVYTRITGLFGLGIVTPLFSYADGSVLDLSGYLLVAGPGIDDATAKRMAVADNKLLLNGERVSGLDYCLLAIEHTATLLPEGPDSINPLTELSFHQRWRDAASSLAGGNSEQAAKQMFNLNAEVLRSPELAENDRAIAIVAYATAYDKLVDLMMPKQKNRDGSRELASRLEKVSAEPGTKDILGRVRNRLLAGVSDAPKDPEKLFALEAAKLREAAGQAPPVIANAASLAFALDRAASRPN